jgi:glucose-1-phosphate cytidylyltransferase
MKAVILAGGFGTRISEESAVRPKPMVEIGGRPILWHIMKIYDAYGISDFVICAGYKGHIIREYFATYFINSSDVTFDLENHTVETHSTLAEPWRVTVLDTGLDTMTGGRLGRARAHIGDETFCLTYGDCVTNVSIAQLVDFHRSSASLVTLTAIQPPGRFGALSLADDGTVVSSFREKLPGDGSWVNGGFFVVEPEALDLVEGDSTVWEAGPLESIAAQGRLHAYKHAGYWQNLDSLRDKAVLEAEWSSGSPRWKVW